MKAITFILHNKGKYTKLKTFFNLTYENKEFAYYETKYETNPNQEPIPAEIHTIYIIDKTGDFKTVAYGYAEIQNLRGIKNTKKRI